MTLLQISAINGSRQEFNTRKDVEKVMVGSTSPLHANILEDRYSLYPGREW